MSASPNNSCLLKNSFLQEDKQLNLDQKAATKKLKLLPIVLAQMHKYDDIESRDYDIIVM